MTATNKTTRKPAANKGATKPAANKGATKPAANKGACMVIVAKSKSGSTEFDAASAPVVKEGELALVGSVVEGLCLNLLAGKEDVFLTEAHAKRGGLVKALPKFANADRQALRDILNATPAKRREGWNAYLAERKVQRNVTLQGIAKGIRMLTAEPKEAKANLREALATWCAANPKALDTLPAQLFDIFADFDLIPVEESASA